jgi:phosphatidylglycerol lysyltransferase
VGSSDLAHADSFALDFLYTIRISGFASISFLIYSLIIPYVYRVRPSDEEFEMAKKIVKLSGRSSLDYFKTYYDKQLFFFPHDNSFLSYKVAGNYAVVLEDPVTPDKKSMNHIIIEFKKFCYNNGLRDIYYRVPAESLDVYHETSKRSLFLGQEGIVDLNSFTLEGGDKKSIRNAINKIKEQGYRSFIYQPPLKDGLVQKLKAVSDEWLKLTGRKEIVFSQGSFLPGEIKNHTVITVENREEKIISFLNIIPDYAINEGTYDLLRKTADAPNGIFDFIIIEMFNYFKANGVRYVNLGFSPLAGQNEPHNLPEISMKYIYDKIRYFSHFRGQREYKEKFGPAWTDKFLIYDNDYDLINVPTVLSRIIKP